jgi:hypothetical protein
MCTHYTEIYTWCNCREDGPSIRCTVYNVEQGCTRVNNETVQLQCYCNTHATKSWKLCQKVKQKKRFQIV